MKITFCPQNISETERQQPAKAQAGREAKAPVSAQGAVYAQGVQNGQGWPVEAAKGQKGKSLIELQQEAGGANVDLQQDYMTLMSHTMSQEDYARLEEEGYDFQSLDPQEAVTIVDRIKAELARSGKTVAGYNDDLDMEELAQVLGSQALAQAVADSFRAADLPLTQENLKLARKAWDMAGQLKPVSQGAGRYLIDNGMDTEVWNLYLAQNSGAEAKGAAAPSYYAEEVQGYYTLGGAPGQSQELAGQMEQVIAQSGRELNDENRQNAQWLLENGLPLTGENMERLEQLAQLQLPVEEKEFAQAAANAIAEGKDPVHARLGEDENLYQKAARLAAYYQSDEAREALAGDVAARRQLEEIRLRMTAEVNVKLLKSGFSIDTAPMEQLVEALKQAEREVAGQYFPQDVQAVEKYRSFDRAATVAAQLPGLPAQAVGVFAQSQEEATLEEFHAQGKALQDTYERAKESYETLMTAPRADLGDHIRKAFGNVDDILRDLGVEPTEETRRAVRILGYNRMEMTAENLGSVLEADRQVKSVVEKLTPAAALKMIRDGVNPLEMSFAQLEDYFEQLPEEYRREAESYSRFLYGLEKNKEITQQERESYIGIYRLVRQIEKSDGAAIGALVNTQAQLHFSNLLSAVRSGKVKSIDVKVTDELGTLSELVRKGESISEQIGKAFTQAASQILTEVSYDEKTAADYRQEELRQLRDAAANGDSQCSALLERGEIGAGADQFLTARALLRGSSNLFASCKTVRGNKTTDMSENAGQVLEQEDDGEAASDLVQGTEENETPGSRLWETLDQPQEFAAGYGELTQEALAAVEEATFLEAGSSLDVRGMQLVHKQLTVMGALAKKEEFFFPLYVGERLTRVHLTFHRGTSRQGQVQVGLQLDDESRIEAGFQLKEGVLTGFFTGQGKTEVTKLQEIADTFREEASMSWTVGSLETGAAALTADTDGLEASPVESAELYRVAKVFLQAVQKRGI